MAGHLTPIAQQLKAAVEASEEHRTLAAALLDAAGPADHWRDVDVGAKLRIIIRPGFGPLNDPIEFVHVSREIS